MGDEVRSSSPVNALGSFPTRNQDRTQHRSPGRDEQPARAADRVSIGTAAGDILRFLRERVLASTRALLEIDDGSAGPEFAEVTEGEPVPAFLGRLLSAQNQLAGRRLPAWPAAVVRERCDAALRAGAQETLDLLAAERSDDAAAVAVVAAVLAEYGRRLAALAADAPDVD